jgi:hypothetical protein
VASGRPFRPRSPRESHSAFGRRQGKGAGRRVRRIRRCAAPRGCSGLIRPGERSMEVSFVNLATSLRAAEHERWSWEICHVSGGRFCCFSQILVAVRSPGLPSARA